MRSAIEVFSDWAKAGKDLGMERGHRQAVDRMLSLSLPLLPPSFTAIDAGCGNGWLARLLSAQAACQNALGVDGSAEMISNALQTDPSGSYVQADLMRWQPVNKVDFVISMEVFYYFKRPDALIAHIAESWLKAGGRLTVGIDHYFENKPSLNWAEENGIEFMTTLSESEWCQAFAQAGLVEVVSERAFQTEEWGGTLIVTGVRS